VVEDEREDGTVRVRLDRSGPMSILSACVAAPRTAPLVAGDRVLVAGDSSNVLYVIGRIGPFRPEEAQSPCALKTGKDTGILRVFSPRNELVFEYDPVGEKARVNIARGNLELVTEDGDIELRSARNVRIGGHTIEMESRELNIKSASARWVVDRMETLTGTLVEKARNAYRTVEQLSQLRTGRMRTLVDQTFHLRSRKAFLKSDEDFKIKGEKIHLG